MKKFYTLVLAVVCAVFAAGATAHEFCKDVSVYSKKQLSRPVEKHVLADVLRSKKAVPAAEEAPGSAVGDFDWFYYSLIGGGGSSQGVAQIYPSEIAQDSIVIFFDYDFGVVAGYDEATGSISIPSNQYLGPINTSQGVIELYFYHAVINEEGTAFNFVDAPLEATFTGSEIVFGSSDCIVFGNNEIGGYFIFAGFNSMIPVNDEWVDNMPVEGWEFYSYSTFVDPWLMFGVMGIEPTELPYDVLVERNVDVEGLYRIVNPYGESSPLYEVNMNTSGAGYIVFSVADPDFVTVQPLVFSGMNDGYDQYLCTNVEGFYAVLGGFSKEDIIGAGILRGMSNYDEEKQQVTFCNVVFSTKMTPDELYDWGEDQPDGSLTLAVLTGVDSVAVDGSDAPVYYNLQGLRVDNPTDGQILIKQQNGKALKVRIVR